MGLDITAYSRLEKLDCVYNEDGEPLDPVTRKELDWHTYARIYINPDFKERADDLEDRKAYGFAEMTEFRAGSYGGYNNWRETLARLAGYPATLGLRYGQPTVRHDAGAWEEKSGPFLELINMSDCEGVIGPKTSAKLLADFEKFKGLAADFADDWWRESYEDWHEAFRLAADGGAVCFH